MRRHGWVNFRIHFSQIGKLPETLCRVSFQGKPASPILGGCRLKKPEKPKTLGWVPFKGAWIIILNTILDHFGPMVAQMLQMVSFGTILDHIAPFREVGTI